MLYTCRINGDGDAAMAIAAIDDMFDPPHASASRIGSTDDAVSSNNNPVDDDIIMIDEPVTLMQRGYNLAQSFLRTISGNTMDAVLELMALDQPEEQSRLLIG